MSLLQFAVAVVIAIAIVAIIVVAARAFGTPIPDWAIRIFWIVVVAIVAIFAIRLVASI